MNAENRKYLTEEQYEQVLRFCGALVEHCQKNGVVPDVAVCHVPPLPGDDVTLGFEVF